MPQRPQAEHLQELRYLLAFFAAHPGERWGELPDAFSPVWVRSGDHEFCTNKPLRILNVVLEDSISWLPAGFRGELGPGSGEVLTEIRVFCFLISEYGSPEIFDHKEQWDETLAAWRTLARLCLLALDDPALRSVETKVTLGELLNNYTSPVSEAELKQFHVL